MNIDSNSPVSAHDKSRCERSETSSTSNEFDSQGQEDFHYQPVP